MSSESTIYLKAILSIQNRDEQFIHITIPNHYSIGQLIQFINNQLTTFYNSESTNIYYMFNEFQTVMNEEAKLGGILLPEDILITSSMIEPGSTLYVEGRTLSPVPAPVAEAAEASEEEQKQEYADEISGHIGQMHRLQNMNIVNIDDQVHLLDIASFLDVFNRIAGVQPAVPAVQVNPIDTFLQALGNLGNVLNAGGIYQDVIVGLHPSELEKLPIFTYKEKKDTNKHKLDTCSVCFDTFKDEDICRELKCNHIFHQKCIDPWLSEHTSCPVCREETGKGCPKLS